MPKKKAYSSKRGKPKSKSSKLPLFLTIGGVAVLIITAFFAFQKKSTTYTPEVTGGPSLKIDKEEIDLGDVKLGNPVKVSFGISNVGDIPLRFDKAPYVEVLEGCWPPTPVIGSMTLKPGETTNLTLEFMMHGSMGGKHDFRVHIPNNDPNKNDLTLIVLSNWVP